MKRKIINAFAPSFPIWAVLYDDDDDSLYFRPVVAIALVQKEDNTHLEPQVLWKHEVSAATELSNLLGYAREDEKTRGTWEDEIASHKEAQGGAPEKEEDHGRHG
jgi:hypothetical protein